MADIGRRIRTQREKISLTQEELASKLGYKSKTTIAKIENGTNDIVQSKVVEFARALDTTPAYLMGWENEEGLTLYRKLLSMPKEKVRLVPENSYENLVVREMKKINQKGKVRLLDTAREMTCSPLYNDNFELAVNATHERTDIEVTEEMRQHDDDIMNDDDF